MITERVYQVTLTTLEPFRVGGKPEVGGPDNPVAVVGNRPVVPGPTLKGVLRSAFEQRLIQQYYDQTRGAWRQGAEVFKPCMAGTQLSDDEKGLIARGLYRSDTESCHYPCDLNRERHQGRCGNTRHPICPVCYFLGAQGLMGFVRVPFLIAPEEVTRAELYSARMDRATHTVATGQNRPYELVSGGSAFSGKMYVLLKDDVLGWDLGSARTLRQDSGGDAWLAAQRQTADALLMQWLIPALTSINLLGGYKSKGFGRVSIEVRQEPPS